MGIFKVNMYLNSVPAQAEGATVFLAGEHEHLLRKTDQDSQKSDSAALICSPQPSSIHCLAEQAYLSLHVIFLQSLHNVFFG